MLGALVVTASVFWFGLGSKSVPSDLDRAHAAYLDGDFEEMTSRIRDVFVHSQTDELMQANALALLTKANDDRNGVLPADWSLPPGVSELRYSVTRKEDSDNLTFKIRLRIHVASMDTLQQVQLIRYRNDIVLDMKAGIGELDSEADDGGFSMGLQIEEATPPADGLYLLRFVLKDGTRREGWFIASDLISSATPLVDAPLRGQVFKHGNPEIVWRDFHAPEAHPYERRGTAVAVTRLNDSNKGWDTTWGLYSPIRSITRTIVGKDPEGTSMMTLEPGRYWLSVEGTEQRTFGPMKLRRGSRAGLSFVVQAP